MKKEERKKLFGHYVIAFLPLLIILTAICLSESAWFDTSSTTFLIITAICFLLSLIFSILVSIGILFRGIKRKRRFKEVFLFILALVINIALVLALIIPNMVYTKKTTPRSFKYRSNLKTIANCLGMYASDHNNIYPDSDITLYPAAENGLLVKAGYLRTSAVHPKTGKDYRYEYYPGKDKFIIWCPSPEECEYKSGKFLKELKYISGVGIVTDPERK